MPTNMKRMFRTGLILLAAAAAACAPRERTLVLLSTNDMPVSYTHLTLPTT